MVAGFVRPGVQRLAICDALVVGTGFAGLSMLHNLLSFGIQCCSIETGSGVGGTCFWNRYPGARCDVENFSYPYSLSPEIEQEWQIKTAAAGTFHARCLIMATDCLSVPRMPGLQQAAEAAA
jgi:cation diffusion facilitator CzcD-associated flavoprotein CzcO